MRPPSAVRVDPWTKAASSLRSQLTQAATSAVLPRRPRGVSASACSAARSAIDVRIHPGLTAFTRTPLGPRMLARLWVALARAALLAAYAALLYEPRSESVLVM